MAFAIDHDVDDCALKLPHVPVHLVAKAIDGSPWTITDRDEFLNDPFNHDLFTQRKRLVIAAACLEPRLPTLRGSG